MRDSFDNLLLRTPFLDRIMQFMYKMHYEKNAIPNFSQRARVTVLLQDNASLLSPLQDRLRLCCAWLMYVVLIALARVMGHNRDDLSSVSSYYNDRTCAHIQLILLYLKCTHTLVETSLTPRSTSRLITDFRAYSIILYSYIFMYTLYIRIYIPI